jgi:tetratricopeptide (TPR) repeat protein
MFEQLKTARTEAEAAPIEARIQHIWIEQGSPAVTLLIGRGLRNLDAGADQEALDDFDAALALDSSVAEAWHRRALARFALGDTRGAIRDIEETLKREPRHFAALRTLARIAASRQDWKGAYAAWQKLLEIDPKTPGGAEKLKDLKRRALGDVT